MIQNTNAYLLKDVLVGTPTNTDASASAPNLIVRNSPGGTEITRIKKPAYWVPPTGNYTDSYPLCTILEVVPVGNNIWYKILFDQAIQYQGGTPGTFRIGYVAYLNNNKYYFESESVYKK